MSRIESLLLMVQAAYHTYYAARRAYGPLASLQVEMAVVSYLRQLAGPPRPKVVN